MRLLAFVDRGRRSIGAELNPDQIVDFRLAQGSMPVGMRALLELGEEGIEKIRRILDKPPRGAILQKRDLHFCSPFSSEERPKIFCIGVNYAAHAAETGSKIPEEPVVFSKFPTSLISPGDNIVRPPKATALDYEVELVVVIGRRGKRIPQSEAYEYILGYTCGNDVSERYFQRHDRQWLRAKSSDTFAPTGPVIVTQDEISDPHHLALGSRVNGEDRQNDNTEHMIFQIPRLVEFISHYLTLEPGDMIFTGTPPGVGLGMKPPQFLNVGDQVEVWIERIGSLTNAIVEP
jgi:2-keto-4-pentenoate hydratase/2-oxohepta-3-ene-1,7-dioic acid hydratase in catechol pathway